mmetsp:Transcript_8904/g.22241  ORF Transcript_8904/g.22241 Transcript_8904/m.22241 type:complete len:91 (-) Transcript_8904:1087-1359(-)
MHSLKIVASSLQAGTRSVVGFFTSSHAQATPTMHVLEAVQKSVSGSITFKPLVPMSCCANEGHTAHAQEAIASILRMMQDRSAASAHPRG